MLFRNLLVAVIGAGALVGCASKVVKPEEYSGYLKDYSVLEEVTSPSGQPVMRWFDQRADLGQYRSIYIKPTVLYPQPQATDKVSTQTLQQVARRCDQAAARELSKVKPLTNKPGPGVLVLAPAITAATANKEGLKPYEVIPIALVVASATAVAGTRDEDTHLYMEFLLVDGGSGKVVGKAVRKLQGTDLENSRSTIQANTFDAAIDQAAADARVVLQQP